MKNILLVFTLFSSTVFSMEKLVVHIRNVSDNVAITPLLMQALAKSNLKDQLRKEADEAIAALDHERLPHGSLWTVEEKMFLLPENSRVSILLYFLAVLFTGTQQEIVCVLRSFPNLINMPLDPTKPHCTVLYYAILFKIDSLIDNLLSYGATVESLTIQDEIQVSLSQSWTARLLVGLARDPFFRDLISQGVTKTKSLLKIAQSVLGNVKAASTGVRHTAAIAFTIQSEEKAKS